LWLQAKDTFETVPGTDLEVSRTANKDNLSHYYVNGKKSSAKEVTELLKSKGVDLENSRFLILQVWHPWISPHLGIPHRNDADTVWMLFRVK
jgi:hypothetical protein